MNTIELTTHYLQNGDEDDGVVKEENENEEYDEDKDLSFNDDKDEDEEKLGGII